MSMYKFSVWIMPQATIGENWYPNLAKYSSLLNLHKVFGTLVFNKFATNPHSHCLALGQTRPWYGAKFCYINFLTLVSLTKMNITNICVRLFFSQPSHKINFWTRKTSQKLILNLTLTKSEWEDCANWHSLSHIM